jgi:hypothetical protein
MFRPVLLLIGLLTLAPAAMAQENDEVDCSDPANVEREECLVLLDDALDVTNFAPLVTPALGLLGLGVLAGGGGSTSTTTTSTTSTTN